MQNKHVTFDEIYDILAVRIIFTPEKREEEINECFNIYVAISKIYKSHPDRLRDWLSHPKANGYQALHVTLMSKQGRWIEVQIRSDRMDEIAEQGFAAHWKYKGIKSESNLDAWMNNVRDILEAAETGPMELMKNMKMDIYNKEVFVFTPKGDLYKLPLGASVLDFAFNIHSKLGCSCIGGRVNGKNEKLNYHLKS
jgi:GTP pyrophosphokinase